MEGLALVRAVIRRDRAQERIKCIAVVPGVLARIFRGVHSVIWMLLLI